MDDLSISKNDIPSRTLEAFLQSHNNLYDKMRKIQTEKFILKHISNLADMDTLEIGCGGGIWSAFFSQRVRSLTCCDLESHIVEAAKINVAHVPNPKLEEINWVVGDISHDLIEGPFDFAFIKDVIEHVEDHQTFLRNISQQMNRNGYVYIATQNSHSLNYLFGKTYYTLKGQHNWYGWDPAHLRFYTAGSLNKLAKEAGLKHIASHGMYHFPYRLTKTLFGKIIELKIFHLCEICCGTIWPFSHTGWAIGSLFKKI